MILLSYLGDAIQTFMALYRRHFPEARIALKLHMLEDHVPKQIKQYRAGLGKLNESGGEAAHAEQNKDDRRAYPMKNQPLKRMMFLMKSQHTGHHPAIQEKSMKLKRKGFEE